MDNFEFGWFIFTMGSAWTFLLCIAVNSIYIVHLLKKLVSIKEAAIKQSKEVR